MKKVCILFAVLLLFSCADKEGEVNPRNKENSSTGSGLEDSLFYSEFIKGRREGPLIPGLSGSLVPQGMAYYPDGDLLIISNYSDDGGGGALTLASMSDEKYEKTIFLRNPDGTAHTDHLGGLALCGDLLWAASGAGIYYVPVETVIDADSGENIQFSIYFETETKGSFASSSDGVLWIGEFTRSNGSYPASESHHIKARDKRLHRAWLGAYKTDTLADMIEGRIPVLKPLIPDFVLSIPDEIQGAAFTEGKILLSASFGRKNYSRLYLFDNPLDESPHHLLDGFSGKQIPLWFLDDINKEGEVNVPPMSEGVVMYGEDAVVLFESAAAKYRDTALFPLDRIQIILMDIFQKR